MMLIALMGGTESHKGTIASEIKRAAQSLFNVNIYPGRNARLPTKMASLDAFLLQRNAGNALNIITDAESVIEFNYLRERGAQVCIVAGEMSRIFSRHGYAILPEYLFVTAHPYDIEDRRTRRQYVTPEEVYSTTYARYRGFAEKNA